MREMPGLARSLKLPRESVQTQKKEKKDSPDLKECLTCVNRTLYFGNSRYEHPFLNKCCLDIPGSKK